MRLGLQPFWPVLLSTLFAATSVLAVENPNPYLGQAKVFYQGLEFEKCLQRLAQAHKWSSSPEELTEIELYGGLCSYNLGRNKEATERFANALRQDPDVQLPALTSPKIAELFRSVARKVAGKAKPPPAEPEPRPEPERFSRPEEPTDLPLVDQTGSEEEEAVALTPDPKAPDRQPAVLVPVQTRSKAVYVAPAVLGGTAVAGGVVGALFGVSARRHEKLANEAGFESDAELFSRRAQRDAAVANISYGVAAAAAVGALVSYLALSQ